MKQLTDNYGRIHDYLRISVTDRCNLRCIYCMGPDGVKNLPHQSILTYEEILQVIKYGAEMGISKIRITGGEPLVRKNLVFLVEQIAAIPGIDDISMTTNGILFSSHARELQNAGLKRVNFSLDSLKEDAYREITRGGDIEQVFKGINEAKQLGMEPVKINTVLIKDFNHHEVIGFLELARKEDIHVRFIEYMPIGEHDKDYDGHYLSLDYVKESAHRAGYQLTGKEHPLGAGPAEYYSLGEGKGSIGLIHSVSKHFCAKCNRLRLTPEGKLKACLYWQEEEYIKPLLHKPEELKSLMQEVIRRKPKEHLMGREKKITPVKRGGMRNMSRTGG